VKEMVAKVFRLENRSGAFWSGSKRFHGYVSITQLQRAIAASLK
jgi:hypothetical protein